MQLTDEWLISFGFEWNPSNQVNENKRMVLQAVDATLFEVYTPRRMDKRIQYCHELQNLFAVLYDEELPLKIRIENYSELVERLTKF